MQQIISYEFPFRLFLFIHAELISESFGEGDPLKVARENSDAILERAKQASVRYCYQRALAYRPQLMGSVTVDVPAGALGEETTISVTENGPATSAPGSPGKPSTFA